VNGGVLDAAALARVAAVVSQSFATGKATQPERLSGIHLVLRNVWFP
jgi:hypothetical protein